MRNEDINKLKILIEAAILRLQPLKPLMREDEQEDLDYYESFDFSDKTDKNIGLSILQRLTTIETRLLKKHSSNLF